MADIGHQKTEKLLAELEHKIAAEYRTATTEVQAKLEAYLAKTEAQRKVQEELLKKGAITQKEYSDWCFRHAMVGKRWTEMRDTLAQDFHSANQIALGMTKKSLPDVYALNANFATYQIEHDARIDTGLSLYNHDTAEYLLGDDRQLMPGPSTRKAREIAANKDMQWNRQKIQSSVLQGVLQGESPYDVAKRLMTVGTMNYNSAVRYARTMTTSAQNAGRYESFRRARDVGVDLTIEWQATLDSRTRHEHRLMHGQRREVDEPFEVDGIKILYPAQAGLAGSSIPQSMIWNCRCTLLAWVKGFEGDTVKTSPKMGDLSFEEWQNEKAPKSVSSPEINSRNSAGRPSAVVGGAKLNKRQESLLSSLQVGGDRVIVNKKAVNMRDLAALSAHEEVEFALFTRKKERMVVRGDLTSIETINEHSVASYRDSGWKWSGHTHVRGGLVPSDGDLKILKLFHQKQSAIYDATGRYVVMRNR